MKSVSPADDKTLTNMIIGIRGDGSEIYNGLKKSLKYQVDLGPTGGLGNTDPVNKKKARQACLELKKLNGLTYSADFTKAEVFSILNFTESQGLG